MLGRLGDIITSGPKEEEAASQYQSSSHKRTNLGDIEKGLSNQNNLNSHADDDSNSNGDSDSKLAEMSAFNIKTEEIRNGISKLQASTQELEDLHRMALDEKGASSTSSKATNLAAGLGATISTLRKQLELLKKENEDISKKLSPGHPFVRIRGAQVTQLSVSLMSTVQSFEDVQTKYRQKYQEKLQRQYKFIKPTATQNELDKFVESAGGDNSSGISLIRAQVTLN